MLPTFRPGKTASAGNSPFRRIVIPYVPASLSLISTFTNYKANYFVDPDGVTLSNLELHKYGRLQSFFNELRLSSQGDSRLSWMFGGSVQFDEISDDEIILPPFISTNTEPLAFLGLPYKITSLRNDNNQKVSHTGSVPGRPVAAR